MVPKQTCPGEGQIGVPVAVGMLLGGGHTVVSSHAECPPDPLQRVVVDQGRGHEVGGIGGRLGPVVVLVLLPPPPPPGGKPDVIVVRDGVAPEELGSLGSWYPGG